MEDKELFTKYWMTSNLIQKIALIILIMFFMLCIGMLILAAISFPALAIIALIVGSVYIVAKHMVDM